MKQEHPIRDLAKLQCKGKSLFIALPKEEIAQQFVQDAVAQGITFHDGTKVNERKQLRHYRLAADGTLSFLSLCDRYSYSYDKRVWRIDYDKYLHGVYDEVIENPLPFTLEEFTNFVHETVTAQNNEDKSLQSYLCSDAAVNEITKHYSCGLEAYREGRISGAVFRTVTVSAVANCLSMTYYNSFLKNEVQ